MADIAGFGSLDEAVTRRAVGRLCYLAAGAWALFALGWMSGLISPFAGFILLTLVAAVLAGGLLIGSQTNFELATLLASSGMDEDVAAQAAAVTPPPLPPAPVLARTVAPARRQLSKGEIEGRSYTVFSDGSIEMQTAFGPRWFASVDLAHEFIGYRNGVSLPVAQQAFAA